jgi:uncharacterized protein
MRARGRAWGTIRTLVLYRLPALIFCSRSVGERGDVKRPEGSETMSNGVVHFEIVADDPEKLASFYSGLFDWKIEKMPMDGMPYWMIHTVPTDGQGMPTEPGGINGGLTSKMSPEQRSINYVFVDSVSDHVSKAQKLGATVLMDKTPIPGMGYFAQLMDPQGNCFGLFQGDPTAS